MSAWHPARGPRPAPEPGGRAWRDRLARDRVKSLEDIAGWVRERQGPVRLHGLRGSAHAAVLARLAEAHPGAPMLVLAEGAKAVDGLAEELRFALGEPPPDQGGRVRPFPAPDTPPYDRFSPQPFVVAQRMDVLYRAGRRRSTPIVVRPWTALALRVPGREAVLARAVRIAVRQEIDRDALVARLVASGYTRQPVVEERGELAVRGGILDVFPPHRGASRPHRAAGRRGRAMREFDPASQRSQRELASFAAPPPREILLRPRAGRRAQRRLARARREAGRAGLERRP